MSRKRKAPKKIPFIDPKYKSTIIPKLINSIMYDGKKTIAEKIVYEAMEKIKTKSKDEPINIFNELYDAYEKKGLAVKKREDVHKMAESNKAFAHFRW